MMWSKVRSAWIGIRGKEMEKSKIKILICVLLKDNTNITWGLISYRR